MRRDVDLFWRARSIPEIRERERDWHPPVYDPRTPRQRVIVRRRRPTVRDTLAQLAVFVWAMFWLILITWTAWAVLAHR